MSGLILVVEDQEDNRQILRDLLKSADYEMTEAETGEEAIAAVARQRPGLILMDIQLPGMDGLEATAVLKQDAATRAIPVIALTALAMKGDEERIRAAGCDGYIAKPMRYQEFLAAIAAQLSPDMKPTPDAVPL